MKEHFKSMLSFKKFLTWLTYACLLGVICFYFTIPNHPITLCLYICSGIGLYVHFINIKKDEYSECSLPYFVRLWLIFTEPLLIIGGFLLLGAMNLFDVWNGTWLSNLLCIGCMLGIWELTSYFEEKYQTDSFQHISHHHGG